MVIPCRPRRGGTARNPQRGTPNRSQVREETDRTNGPARAGDEGQDSGHEQSHSCYEVSRSILPSIFGASGIDIGEITEIIRLLRNVQQKANMRHRFHLVVESEQGDDASDRFQHVVTRVLFSPTVTMESVAEEIELHVLTRVLNAISWKSAPSGTIRNRSVTGERLSTRRRTPGRLFADEDELPEDENRRSVLASIAPRRLTFTEARVDVPSSRKAVWPREVRDFTIFPTWFPFLGDKYTEGPPASNEILYLDSEIVNKFQFLEPFQILWIYTEFFGFMQKEAKRQKIPAVCNTLKYSQFTPPWIRTQMVKGDPEDIHSQNPVFLGDSCIPGLRYQRNVVGYRRLAYVLAAFIMKEEFFAREPLQHLLRIKPTVDVSGGKRRRREEAEVVGDGRDTVRARIATRPVVGQTRRAQDTPHSMLHERRGATFNTPPGTGEQPLPRRVEHAVRATSQNETCAEGNSVFEIVDIEDGRQLGIGLNSYGTPRRHARRLETASIDLDVEEGRGARDDRVTRDDRSEAEEDQDPRPSNRCANGARCYMANSVFNGPEGITSKCKICKHILHDRCGGGEDGDRICIPCKDDIRRREIV